METPSFLRSTVSKYVLSQGIATVDVDPAVRRQCSQQALPCPHTERRMATIERADSHGDGHVKQRLVRLELEVLDGTWRNRNVPTAICARDADLATAIALADRSMPST